MRYKWRLSCATAAAVCGLAVTGSVAGARAFHASPVPVDVERAIRERVPAHLRYLPTEVPVGYRYANWRGGRYGLDIFFAGKGRPRLGFHAYGSGSAPTCKQGARTYRFDSLRISYEKDRYSEQWWRCARGGRISIEATTRLAKGSPSPRSVAAMVASTKRPG